MHDPVGYRWIWRLWRSVFISWLLSTGWWQWWILWIYTPCHIWVVLHKIPFEHLEGSALHFCWEYSEQPDFWNGYGAAAVNFPLSWSINMNAELEKQDLGGHGPQRKFSFKHPQLLATCLHPGNSSAVLVITQKTYLQRGWMLKSIFSVVLSRGTSLNKGF